MLRMNVKMKMARMTIEDAWAIDATTMAVNPRFYIQDPLFIIRHPFITRPLVFNIDDPAFLYTRPPRHTHIYIYIYITPLGLI